MYSMQQAAQLRDVHFHNSGKPYQFIKNISIFNKNSAWYIISCFSNIFENWKSVIIDGKLLGKFIGDIFNVQLFRAKTKLVSTCINAMQNQFPKWQILCSLWEIVKNPSSFITVS